MTGIGYGLFAIAVVLALGGAEAGLVIWVAGAAVVLAAVALAVAFVYRYVGTPGSEAELRELAKRKDGAVGFATTVFPAAGAGSPSRPGPSTAA